MVNPAPTGSSKLSYAGTPSIGAPSGMVDGDRIVVAWRCTADNGVIAPPGGWVGYEATNERAGWWVSPPLIVAESPWAGTKSSGNMRTHIISYTPGDGDLDPVAGSFGTTEGVAPGVTIPDNGALLFALFTTGTTNSSWTKPAGLATDLGVQQSGFTNVAAVAYGVGFIAGATGDLTATWGSGGASTHFNGLLYVPGPAGGPQTDSQAFSIVIGPRLTGRPAAFLRRRRRM